MPEGRSGTSVRTVGLDAVDLARVVRGEDLLRALGRLLGGRRLAARDHLADRRLATLEVGAALVADEDQLDLNVLRLEL